MSRESAVRPKAPALGGEPLEAAAALLGRLLVSTVGGVTTTVRICEVEAYGGADDPASHAQRGPTARNHNMFGPPGRWYVYRSHGLHWCANVVCGPEGDPGAVLLRGGVPVSGSDEMVRRRGRADHLADGPGKLCSALGITGEHDGAAAFSGEVRITGRAKPGRVMATPRIGISQATERLWRLTWSSDSG